jgi:hypothetical protein
LLDIWLALGTMSAEDCERNNCRVFRVVITLRRDDLSPRRSVTTTIFATLVSSPVLRLPQPPPLPHRGRRVMAAMCLATGVALLVSGLYWTPVGTRKAGRVLVVEKHSTWEPTTEPYGTQIYGERGSYNYAAAYDYCGQYFEMSRLLEAEALNDTALSRCDVLVIKTPTARYAPAEVDAIEQFVAQGGSLLLVGDHTNVFRMSTCLNDLARRFGFSFRNDLLFRVGTPYKQHLTRPVPAHPAIQHVPQMDFAVSCSIDPGRSAGRMVIRNTGLWNLPPAYQEVNYHPQAEYRPQMQYGAWCQMWSTTYGRGRVLAFADSTLFSNFCVFQPGKAEMLRGMLHWLNHASPLDRRGLWLLVAVPWALAGLTCVGVGWWSSRGTRAAGTVLMAAGLAGWAVGVGAVSTAHRWALPMPPCLRPLQHVVIDRTLSEVPLFTGAFTDGEEGVGYGMFEQWIPRLGNFLSRRTGQEVFGGDALVVICPTRSVPAWYRERLVQFVEAGGKLVVLDSADVSGSTANSLLELFGLASNHNAQTSAEAPLKLADGATEVTLETSCEIAGGEPLAWLGEMPVAARSRYGRGTVTAIGCGALFNDAKMGVHWLPEPSPEVRRRYEVLYTFLRAALASAIRTPHPRPGREGGAGACSPRSGLSLCGDLLGKLGQFHATLSRFATENPFVVKRQRVNRVPLGTDIPRVLAVVPHPGRQELSGPRQTGIVQLLVQAKRLH